MSRNRAAVVQKDDKTNTWWFVADVGRAGDGRRKQAKRRGVPTKKAAQLELDRLRVGVHDQ
ncbi:MAG TPA: Arm DNA-binding domain-containing protein [Acidimicrobiales bacterium]|nr:Arm DNA-binding domain-containing protein [Acidimicrobiales bacterium]